MAVSEQERYHLRRHLDEVLRGQDAAVSMSYLPAVTWADMATKRDLDVGIAEVKLDLGEVKRDVGQLKVGLGEVKRDTSQLKVDVGQLKDEVADLAQ